MSIELNIAEEIFIPKFYPLLFDYSNRFEFYKGSAGSGKSHFITQKLVLKALKSKRRAVIARRFGNTNRNSTFALFKQILTDFKLTPHCNIRESDMYIKLPNDSEFIFLGLDNEQKLLSLTDISDVWVEEVFEITQDFLEQLNLRLRGTAANLQLFASFNPISKSHWLYKYCEVNPPSSFLLSHSTYKDNPFLPKDYVDTIKEMEFLNPHKYKIYGLGEWGVDAEGLVYTNWRTQDFDELELAAKGYEHRVGMDMGFVDPSTIVSTLYDEENKKIYIYDSFYKTGCQLDELVAALIERELRRTKVYCDSADARAISFFRQNGLNVVASKKGKGSVSTGIAFIQNHQLIIKPAAAALIREIENYSYIKSKKTGEFTNDTTHEYSHTLDALRYAYSELYMSNKVSTLHKGALGL